MILTKEQVIQVMEFITEHDLKHVKIEEYYGSGIGVEMTVTNDKIVGRVEHDITDTNNW